MLKDNLQSGPLATPYDEGSQQDQQPVGCVPAMLLLWVDNQAWPGRTGLTDKAVLKAHLQSCLNAQKRYLRPENLSYHLSARDGAEKAQCSPMTFSRSTIRHIKAGRIETTAQATEAEAKEYRICEKFANDTLYGSSNKLHAQLVGVSHKRTNFVDLSLETCGVFERPVLGKSAESVWQCIQHQPRTQNEIAAVTGKCKATVSESLKKLMHYRVVEAKGKKRPYTYLAFPDYDFNTLADILDSKEISPQREARHQRQRKYFRTRVVPYMNKKASP